MTEAIVFDLWETLATKNVPVSSLLRKRFDIPETSDYVRKYEEAVQLRPWDSEDQMARGFLRAFGRADDPDSVAFATGVFRQGIDRATLFDGVPELLGSLRQQGLKLGLLSNTTIFESAVVEKLGIGKLLDAMVFSWEIGVLKPEHEAFAHVLGELGVPPEAAVFADDGIRNVESARDYGMQAIVFEGIGPLKQVLAALIIT